jgi:hypothetical protein
VRLRQPTPWLALGLAFLAVSTAARIVDTPALSIEPARSKRAHLDPEASARLESLLSTDLHATIEYWVTPRAELPPELRELEPRVRAAFDTLAALQPERLRLSIHHPGDSPQLASHRTEMGHRTTQAPRVLEDEWTESEFLSSLRFTLGASPAAVRNGLLPVHTADLPLLLITHLEELANPSRPRVLLDAPEGYIALESLLKDRGELARAPISQLDEQSSADLLIWIQPEEVSALALARLDQHLQGGGDILLAGSSTRSSFGRSGSDVLVQMSSNPALEEVLSSFGAGAREGVLLDPLCDAVPISKEESLPAHHLLTVPAPNQDFRALEDQPNGSLLFDSATALELDPARLFEHGLRASVLATSSPRAVLATPPGTPISLKQLAALRGTPAARAPIAALLTHEDPSRGRVLVLGSSSPLTDAHLGDERFSHLALVRLLLDDLTSTDRVLLQRVNAASSRVLPELSSATRARARLLVALLLPLLIMIGYFLRRDKPSGARLTPRLAALTAVFTAPIAISLLLSPLSLFGQDASADHRHQLDEEGALYFEQLLGELDGVATLELWRPERAELPVRLAAALDRASLSLRSLCETTALDFRERRADAAEVREALGLSPRVISDPFTELRGAREVCVGARVQTPDGASVSIDLSDVATHERLRFRVALALRTLREGAPPLITVSSDRPLISPAEAVLDYQNEGLFTPGGADPYEAARAWLSAHGFAVEELDTKSATPRQSGGALLLFQPRRDANAVYGALYEHLNRGGSALLCAQEHELLARRLSENDHAFAYWPRPLYPDLDASPFKELGLTLDPRPLFDSLRGTALIPTRSDRPGQAPQTILAPASEPFCIRVLGSDSFGELVLAGANALSVDEAQLDARGLELEPWLYASEGSWIHAWEGGDLTLEALSGSREDAANIHPDTAPILAADLSGAFPSCRVNEDGALVIVQDSAKAQGLLSVVGTSAPFRSAHLHAEGTDHAQLLLHSVARLSLEPALVKLLAHREAPRGFEQPAPAERFAWRMLLIGCLPLMLASVGARRLRRRS